MLIPLGRQRWGHGSLSYRSYWTNLSVATASKNIDLSPDVSAVLRTLGHTGVSTAPFLRCTAPIAPLINTRALRCTASRYGYPPSEEPFSCFFRSGTEVSLSEQHSKTWVTAFILVISTLLAHPQALKLKMSLSSTSTEFTLLTSNSARARRPYDGSKNIASFCVWVGTPRPSSDQRRHSRSTSSTPITNWHFRENSTSTISMHLFYKRPTTVAERRWL